MIRINDIDIYRDGGSVGIFGYVSHNGLEKSSFVAPREPIIVIDYSIGTTTPGEWYLVWKDKGAQLIQDEEFKSLVKQSIQTQVNHLLRMLEKINNL
jgi:hypothetical protein